MRFIFNILFLICIYNPVTQAQSLVLQDSVFIDGLMADASEITLFEGWVIVADHRSNRVYFSNYGHLAEFSLLDIEKCYPGLKTMRPSAYVFNQKLYIHANYGHVILFDKQMHCDGHLISSKLVAPLKAVSTKDQLISMHTGIPGITKSRSLSLLNQNLEIIVINDALPEDAYSMFTYNVRNLGALAYIDDNIYYIHGFDNQIYMFDSKLNLIKSIKIDLPSLIKPPNHNLQRNNIQLNPKQRADLFLNSSFITQLFVNDKYFLVDILIQPGARKKLNTTKAHSLHFIPKDTKQTVQPQPYLTSLKPIQLSGDTLTSFYANEDGGLIIYKHKIIWE